MAFTQAEQRAQEVKQKQNEISGNAAESHKRSLRAKKAFKNAGITEDDERAAALAFNDLESGDEKKINGVLESIPEDSILEVLMIATKDPARVAEITQLSDEDIQNKLAPLSREILGAATDEDAGAEILRLRQMKIDREDRDLSKVRRKEEGEERLKSLGRELPKHGGIIGGTIGTAFGGPLGGLLGAFAGSGVGGEVEEFQARADFEKAKQVESQRQAELATPILGTDENILNREFQPVPDFPPIDDLTQDSKLKRALADLGLEVVGQGLGKFVIAPTIKGVGKFLGKAPVEPAVKDAITGIESAAGKPLPRGLVSVNPELRATPISNAAENVLASTPSALGGMGVRRARQEAFETTTLALKNVFGEADDVVKYDASEAFKSDLIKAVDEISTPVIQRFKDSSEKVALDFVDPLVKGPLIRSLEQLELSTVDPKIVQSIGILKNRLQNDLLTTANITGIRQSVGKMMSGATKSEQAGLSEIYKVLKEGENEAIQVAFETQLFNQGLTEAQVFSEVALFKAEKAAADKEFVRILGVIKESLPGGTRFAGGIGDVSARIARTPATQVLDNFFKEKSQKELLRFSQEFPDLADKLFGIRVNLLLQKASDVNGNISIKELIKGVDKLGDQANLILKSDRFELIKHLRVVEKRSGDLFTLTDKKIGRDVFSLGGQIEALAALGIYKGDRFLQHAQRGLHGLFNTPKGETVIGRIALKPISNYPGIDSIDGYDKGRLTEVDIEEHKQYRNAILKDPSLSTSEKARQMRLLNNRSFAVVNPGAKRVNLSDEERARILQLDAIEERQIKEEKQKQQNLQDQGGQ